MSLSLLHKNPRGDRMMLTSEQTRIADLIQTGDPISGWDGDPQMFVTVLFDLNTRQGKLIEVWRRAEDGKDYLVMTFLPQEFDHRVLMRLASHDTRKVDVLAEIEKHDAYLERKNDEMLADLEKEAKAFIKFARKRLYLDD